MYNILYIYILFEGVSVTTVILAPGACGMGVRGAGFGTTSPDPVDPVTNSKNAEVVRRLRTSELARSPNRAWHPMGPQRGQWDPKGSKWSPIGTQFDPIWIKFEPNWVKLGPSWPNIYIHKLPISRPADVMLS